MVRRVGSSEAEHFGRPYWGVRQDIGVLIKDDYTASLLPYIAVPDLPFSFVLDTVLLPFDVSYPTPKRRILDMSIGDMETAPF